MGQKECYTKLAAFVRVGDLLPTHSEPVHVEDEHGVVASKVVNDAMVHGH